MWSMSVSLSSHSVTAGQKEWAQTEALRGPIPEDSQGSLCLQEKAGVQREPVRRSPVGPSRRQLTALVEEL